MITGLIIGFTAGFLTCLALVEIMDRVALRGMRD